MNFREYVLGLIFWIAGYLATGLFWLWILRWEGAEWLEGWKAWAAIDWFAGHWRAEQIRLYALLLFLIETLVFVVGLFVPEVRLATQEI